MQRKYVVLLIAIILNCSVNVTGLFSENALISSAVDQSMGCITVEAAETEDDKNDFEEMDKVENEVIEKNELKELIEEPEGMEKKEDESEVTQESAETNLENCIYNVLFPTNPKAYFDPENLSGKGQVFSDEFRIENYGNTDVAIRIKNIDVYYKSTKDVYELSKEEISDNQSNIKKINVDVIWKNESQNMEKVLNVSEGITDEYVLLLKASEYDENDNFVRLNDSSAGSFYFTGTLNSNRDLVWEDGEVQVSFDYEIENIDEEVLLAGQDEFGQQDDLREEGEQEETLLRGLSEPGKESVQREHPDSNEEQQELTDNSQETGYPEVERKIETEEEKQ